MSLSEQSTQLTENFIRSQTPEVQAIINSAFDELGASGFGSNALREGDKAKHFKLPNARGSETTLQELLAKGPVVLSFYRGGWCPYCNLEFKALNQILPKIKELGANLVGISPELPDNSISTVEKHGLKFEVLSDIGNVVARNYGILMAIPLSLRPLYLDWGLDVPTANGDDTWELPIPATYIIDNDGTVEFAYINVNYTQRMEPGEIIKVLKSMQATV